jgi:3-methyladenine DNA glycosylase AlkD
MRRRDAIRLAGDVEAEIRRAGTRTRAEGARRYLKLDLVLVGADTAAVRRAVRLATRPMGEADRASLLAFVGELWGRGVFELRAAAVDALVARRELLQRGDVVLLERLIRDSGTWALVDTLAVHVAGPLVERFPGLRRVLDRWSHDRDFWVRRAAMLALLLALRRGAGEFERFSRYADRMLEEKEFFIRKAIGWVLREVGKSRPGLVSGWLATRTGRASGVTVREAVRYLPERQRRALRAAYRERRAATRFDVENGG